MLLIERRKKFLCYLRIDRHVYKEILLDIDLKKFIQQSMKNIDLMQLYNKEFNKNVDNHHQDHGHQLDRFLSDFDGEF